LPKREDRLELARRLHDGPAQQLIALGFKLDDVIGSPDLAPNLRRIIRQARLDLIDLTEGLRDELYLLENLTLEESVEEVRKILPKTDVEAKLPNLNFEPRVETTLAQILLELARNAAKHARPSRFWIIYSLEDQIPTFRIGNDGAAKVSIKESSLGLKLISEQARHIDASMELETSKEVFEYTIRMNSHLL
jgi:signal transduction histidine kinase